MSYFPAADRLTRPPGIAPLAPLDLGRRRAVHLRRPPPRRAAVAAGGPSVAGGVAAPSWGRGVAFVTVKATDDDRSALSAPAQPTDPTAPPPSRRHLAGAGVRPAGPGSATWSCTALLDIQAVLAAVVAVGGVDPDRRRAERHLPGTVPARASSSRADGLVLTNNHVDRGRRRHHRSRPTTARSTTPTWSAREPSRDIAAGQDRATASALTPATLGDTDNLRVGDTVLAIGNALNLGDTPYGHRRHRVGQGPVEITTDDRDAARTSSRPTPPSTPATRGARW